MKKSFSNSSGSASCGEEEFQDPLDETLTIIVNEGGVAEENEEDIVDVEEDLEKGDVVDHSNSSSSTAAATFGKKDDLSVSPETISNATENVLYQEIPMGGSKNVSPPTSIVQQSVVDDYAEPQLVITSPLPSTHSSISSSATIPISTNGSPLYAQVHKEPRTEIQKIHSTIPNTFKGENLGCILTTFGTKTPSMTSFGKDSSGTTPMSSLGASGSSGGGGSRQQLLAASYSNDLNSSKDSMLGGSTDMLSDSGNHSDSWMYPQGGHSAAAGGGRKRGGGRAPPSSFTEQLNQVLADRERCVGLVKSRKERRRLEYVTRKDLLGVELEFNQSRLE